MLSWLIISPILIAVLLYIFPFKKTGTVIAIMAQTVLTACAVYVFCMCRENEIITKIGNYEGILGITLKADALSSVFVMLTTIIFLIVDIYNIRESFSKLFWFLLFVWEALLIGIFLSGDLFNIFVLIEVATVIVSILIMFNRDSRSMYDGMVYLMTNTVAIQFYLFGIGYIYKLTGTLDIDTAAQAVGLLSVESLILPYALIITSVSLKCALMPLFSWLPKAHGTPGAPSAVSAILSGLHIKSGIYLFIRVQSIFVEISLPEFFLAAGIITGIAGFVFALSQTDIKLILAYHTISQIGMIMIGLSSADVYSYTGSVYHIVNHAFFKSSLFLCAGIISQEYGTRNIYRIRGILKRMPFVGAAILMAIFGITGAPFFNGSISKYFIMSGADWVLNGVLIFINLGTIISFIKYSSMLFGSSEFTQNTISVDRYKQAAILILGVLCLVGGIFGEQVVWLLFNVDVSVDTAGYAQKAVLFIVSAGVGYLIYKYYIKRSKLFKLIREIDLGFRGICVSIGVFFALILIVTRLSVF